MPSIDSDELKAALVRAQEAIEGIRALSEGFVRRRIRDFRLADPAGEDEIAERAFRQVARALCTYDRERADNPFSWFMTIVNHSIIDYCRSHKLPLEPLSEVNEPVDSNARRPGSDFVRKQVHEVLVEAMSRLSSPRRREMLLIVVLFPEMHYREIAKITGQATENAARELKYQTMKEMREVLAGLGYDPAMFGELLRGEQ